MLAANGLTSLIKFVESKVEKGHEFRLLLNAQNSSGNTPLHWAIINNKVESAQALLDLGTDANLINEKGETPLDIALMYELADLVPVLSKQTKIKDTELDDDDEGEIKVVKEKVTGKNECKDLFAAPVKQDKQE